DPSRALHAAQGHARSHLPAAGRKREADGAPRRGDDAAHARHLRHGERCAGHAAYRARRLGRGARRALLHGGVGHGIRTIAPVKAEALPETVSRAEFLNLFLAVFLPMFMAAVDQTLLATATPAIAQTLGGLRDTSWIAVGYLLASATIVPVYGRLGDLRGRRDVLLIALGVFALGSAACGAAQSLPQLVAARVLQGLGGGGLMVLSQALIGELVPPRERARFQGYFATVFTAASIGGPVIGGIVVSH